MARGIGDDWAALQRRSHLPEAQASIREAIRAGKIRIAPLGGDRVRIIPLDLDGGRGWDEALRPFPPPARPGPPAPSRADRRRQDEPSRRAAAPGDRIPARMLRKA